MPRLAAARATTTRDTVANLWAAALAAYPEGITVRLPSRRDAFNVRNKLHAHRAHLRRSSRLHTGFETSAYDSLKVIFRPELDYNLNPTGHWRLSITKNDYIQFELLTPPPADEGVTYSNSAQEPDSMTPDPKTENEEDGQVEENQQVQDQADGEDADDSDDSVAET